MVHEPQSKHPQHSTHSGLALNELGHLPFSLRVESREPRTKWPSEALSSLLVPVGKASSSPWDPHQSSSRSPSTFGRTPLTSLASLLLLDVQGDLASLGRPGSVNPRSTQAGQARQSLQYPGALPTTIMRRSASIHAITHQWRNTHPENVLQPYKFIPEPLFLRPRHFPASGFHAVLPSCRQTNPSPLTFVQPFSLFPSTVSRETWSTLAN
ncbi:hypothetical protein CH63R_09073 [Colletotrichum higginsianum IMI 349063]|uniref:Uncharacterized protein n=1 Tax=Colletotrichum higginsianum (strain IMI 349063) TaxID=759273 RepID=A0A1B7Y6A7_COLHI|nr:hypothetical protein CH63R_09073 [Colletotrichum higginsianum IMI 349063]OBR07552.1 hypothetical protein CH63R_09073 [Colletotrichum higginsianum IMI 349063]